MSMVCIRWGFLVAKVSRIAGKEGFKQCRLIVGKLTVVYV